MTQHLKRPGRPVVYANPLQKVQAMLVEPLYFEAGQNRPQR